MEDRHNGWLALHSPNIVNLCMDSYGGKEQQGRLYHLYTAEAVPFSSLLEAMDRMEERDRRLIILRYYQNQTQTQTARQLGMTQVQVSRREKKLMQYFRQELLE